MTDDHAGASPTARRWLRTLRTIRRRVRGTVPPPRRYLLIVTPTDPTCGLPLHVESGGENDGDHWPLLYRAGEVVRRRGVPCLVTVHDLDEPDPTLATVAWLWLDSDGNVATRPADDDAPEAVVDMSHPFVATDAPPLDPEADHRPVLHAGDPCPACGGAIVVDATVRYTRVPLRANGTSTDEGEGGDVEWDGDPYCGGCGQRVRVEL